MISAKNLAYLMVFFVLMPVNQIAAATHIRLAYSDFESYPFQMGSGLKVANPPGLALDILHQVAIKLDLSIQFIRLPGKRVLQDIQKNKVDGGFIFSYNTQRAAFARYPMISDQPDQAKRIASISYYFYALQSSGLSHDTQMLIAPGQKVGAHLGFSIVKQLKDRRLEVFEVRTTEQLFNMLLAKRVSLIVVQDTMAGQYLRRNPIANIEKLEPPITTKAYYLVFSHSFAETHSGLVYSIWNQIEQIRDEVVSKYGSQY